MFGLIKKLFIGLLIVLANGSNHKKCVLLSNQKYIIQPTRINLHTSEYSRECHYYTFAVTVDKWVESSNILNDWTNNLCLPNNTENLNVNVFNMVTGINLM